MMSGQERKEGGMPKKEKSCAKICGNISGGLYFVNNDSGLYFVNNDSGHFCL